MDSYEELWDDWEVLDLLHEEMDDDAEDGQGVVRRRRRRVVTGELLMDVVCFYSA